MRKDFKEKKRKNDLLVIDLIVVILASARCVHNELQPLLDLGIGLSVLLQVQRLVVLDLVRRSLHHVEALQGCVSVVVQLLLLDDLVGVAPLLVLVLYLKESVFSFTYYPRV